MSTARIINLLETIEYWGNCQGEEACPYCSDRRFGHYHKGHNVNCELFIVLTELRAQFTAEQIN